MAELRFAPGQLNDRACTSLIEDPVVHPAGDDPEHLIRSKVTVRKVGAWIRGGCLKLKSHKSAGLTGLNLKSRSGLESSPFARS